MPPLLDGARLLTQGLGGYIRVILDYIGIMEKKMETTIMWLYQRVQVTGLQLQRLGLSVPGEGFMAQGSGFSELPLQRSEEPAKGYLAVYCPFNWVAVKEVKLSWYDKETRILTMYPLISSS